MRLASPSIWNSGAGSLGASSALALGAGAFLGLGFGFLASSSTSSARLITAAGNFFLGGSGLGAGWATTSAGLETFFAAAGLEATFGDASDASADKGFFADRFATGFSVGTSGCSVAFGFGVRFGLGVASSTGSVGDEFVFFLMVGKKLVLSPFKQFGGSIETLRRIFLEQDSFGHRPIGNGNWHDASAIGRL